MMDSVSTIEQMRKRTDTVLLSFSCGKDSIAAWCELRKAFPRVIPYYMYLVPGLEFIEESLAYYEQFFGTRIMRVPHPSLYRMLNQYVYQPPNRRLIIARAGLPSFSYRQLEDALREDLGLGPEVYVATGVRAADSVMRYLAIKKTGSIIDSKKQFYPIWDWRKQDLLDCLRRECVKLPVDYRVWGRSFDGLYFHFLDGMKREFPADYERVLEWFPLADVELKRRQYAGL